MTVLPPARAVEESTKGAGWAAHLLAVCHVEDQALAGELIDVRCLELLLAIGPQELRPQVCRRSGPRQGEPDCTQAAAGTGQRCLSTERERGWGGAPSAMKYSTEAIAPADRPAQSSGASIIVATARQRPRAAGLPTSRSLSPSRDLYRSIYGARALVRSRGTRHPPARPAPCTGACRTWTTAL